MDASRLVRTNSDAAKETHRCSSISPSRSKIGRKPAYESVNLVRFHRERFGVTQLFTLAQAYLSLSGVSLKEGPEFQGLIACLFPSERQILRWS